MCVNCIRSRVNISEGIPKQTDIFWCKGCNRYLEPPNKWVFAELESRELLSFCLKKLKGLSKVKLIDASFIYTEPHSRRIKTKLTIQQEVYNSVVLQEVFIVEYVVHSHFCDDCHHREADKTWNTVVQLRQRVSHKRTFFWLEQIILKHRTHETTTFIEEFPDGLNFYFSHKNHGKKFLDFLGQHTMIRWKTAKQLVTSDLKSNTYDYNFTYSVEMAPICREDLICLPPKLVLQLGDCPPILLTIKVNNTLQFLDPFSLFHYEVDYNYWHNPFNSLLDRGDLVEFYVIDIDLLGPTYGKYALAEATVILESDFGVRERYFITRTHLGNVLNAGDTVAGYDFTSTNWNDKDVDNLKGKTIPSEVVLVRKTYPDRRRKRKDRKWQLDSLTKQRDELSRYEEEQTRVQYEEFLRDLEEDPDMRREIQLYKKYNDNDYVDQDGDAMMDSDDDNFPDVQVQELLEKVNTINLSGYQ